MKPRCNGNRPGVFLSGFQCRLDEGHDGRCKPYRPPTVDEWRAMRARVALLESVLDGFRHSAQVANNRRAHPGGQQAGATAWMGVSYGMCLSIIRDVDHAIGPASDFEAGVRREREQ